jgi:hypothetical protein
MVLDNLEKMLAESINNKMQGSRDQSQPGDSQFATLL